MHLESPPAGPGMACSLGLSIKGSPCRAKGVWGGEASMGTAGPKGRPSLVTTESHQKAALRRGVAG